MPILRLSMPGARKHSVAGIDRWRGGWIVAESPATAAGQREGSIELWACESIDEAVERLSRAKAVAIDMPIALAESGTRAAEADIRAVLGSSARSVFTSPTRAGAEAMTQADATVVNRAHGGPGISAQAFGLFASIRELRAALGGPGGRHWWETHPETAFVLMNDGVPLASKRTGLGVAQRLIHLRSAFGDLDDLLLTTPAKVPIDDVLDALGALWSALRIASGQAAIYGPADRDDQGFALGIRV